MAFITSCSSVSSCCCAAACESMHAVPRVSIISMCGSGMRGRLGISQGDTATTHCLRRRSLRHMPRSSLRTSLMEQTRLPTPSNQSIWFTGLSTVSVRPLAPPPPHGEWLRVRVEIMGSQKCRIVGKSQSVLMMINPIIFTRPRSVYLP
eukprot:SAG25_NODE_3675_length_1003_cov_1.250000_1_plen_148_part_10